MFFLCREGHRGGDGGVSGGELVLNLRVGGVVKYTFVSTNLFMVARMS